MTRRLTSTVFALVSAKSGIAVAHIKRRAKSRALVSGNGHRMLSAFAPMLIRCMAILLAMVVVSCAGALASEYYQVGQGEALYLAWTEDNDGHLQGQVEIVGMQSSGSTQLKTTNASFTGTRNGSDVSLTFGLLSAFSGATWTGHIGWRTLTLVIPTSGVPQRVTLTAGSFEQFQTAVTRMQGAVSVNQGRVAMYNAMKDAGTHVVNGSSMIDRGLNSLRTLLPLAPTSESLRTKYAQEWQKMLSVWHDEQRQAQVTPMTCYQQGQVQYQAGQVDYELGQFKYLDGQLQYVGSVYADAVRDVTQGIGEIENWAPEFDRQARAYAASIGQAYAHNTLAALSPKILNAQKSLKIFAGRWSSVESNVRGYDERAQRQDNEARSFAKSIPCSG